jgi:hypothetical protein
MDITVGDWNFEFVQIRARKTKTYGSEYSGIATINIINGEPCIDGLLCKDSFSLTDYKAFEEFLTTYGFNSVNFCRNKQGEKYIKRIRK